jgi:eukaryotic-like serine/threonine-protein kinase
MSIDPSKAKSIFLAAVEKPAADRQPFLDQACGNDAELRQRVEDLLAAHELGSGPIERPLNPTAAAPVDANATSPPATATAQPGTRIGPYKLLQEIGEGGMGTVWMAEQTEPVRRMVALKLIKPGMDSALVMARFEAERQAIALMDHPYIAKVLDAGTTALGRPYFVMELVKGIQITKYCDAHQLTPRERLELFVPVCHAIQHAHQKGIIHRDIKPSNVLIASYDGKPVPKVIDFGVAKATALKLTERTLFTAFGGMVGTLEYMSPEQAEFNALDIDTRSDIYALGVLLYELLTGTTPLSRKRLKQAALAEALRLIREEEPPKPSTRLSESKDSLAGLAAQRKMEPAKLTKVVRGDLDWMAMKALDKDRNRRYETANAFALDVQRYLHDEPVMASPPSAMYRLRKYAKRNKGPLAAAALVVLALVGGMLGTTLGLLEAQHQRDDAEANELRAKVSEQKAIAEESNAKASAQNALAKEAEAKQAAAHAKVVLEFFQEKVLAAARPIGQEGGLGIDATIRAAVDAAEPQIAQAFADNPVVEASIRNVLGESYSYLGENTLAIRQLERALELRKAKLGPSHLDTLISMNDLAQVYKFSGRPAEALPLLQEALKFQKEKLGPSHLDTLIYMENLASAYHDLDRLDEALPLFEETLKILQDKHGPSHPITLISMNNLARAYLDAGRLAEAVALFEYALKLCRGKHGASHPETLMAMNNLAFAYQATGRRAEALPIFEEALKLRKDILGPSHPDTIMTMCNLASAYQDAGRRAEALPLFEESLKLSKDKLGPSHPETLGSMAYLAKAYLDDGQLHDAEKLFRDCLSIREKEQPDGWTTFNTKSQLGASLLGQKKYADAEPLLLQGYEGMKQRADKIPAGGQIRITEAIERLVQLYEATGQEDQAAKWRKELVASKQKLKESKK